MLKCSDLEVGYKGNRDRISVARSIQFQLEPGEIAAIVGVNGIGKSTLLRTIGRVQQKLSGQITVADKDIEVFNNREWAKVLSVVLTEAPVTRNLTVKQLVSLGRHPYTNWIGTLSDADIQKILEAISLVGIEGLTNKKCYELSDGQLQKVMLARALAQDTRIILLDEPTTHLDLYHKVQILKLLQQIAHETGKMVLFTTHEIDLAIQLCDKILIMEENGCFFGAPHQLIESRHFNNLFPADTIQFDESSGTFKVTD